VVRGGLLRHQHRPRRLGVKPVDSNSLSDTRIPTTPARRRCSRRTSWAAQGGAAPTSPARTAPTGSVSPPLAGTATLGGHVFIDGAVDGAQNGAFDAGEGIGGLTVTLTTRRPTVTVPTQTDGSYSFEGCRPAPQPSPWTPAATAPWRSDPHVTSGSLDRHRHRPPSPMSDPTGRPRLQRALTRGPAHARRGAVRRPHPPRAQGGERPPTSWCNATSAARTRSRPPPTSSNPDGHGSPDGSAATAGIRSPASTLLTGRWGPASTSPRLDFHE